MNRARRNNANSYNTGFDQGSQNNFNNKQNQQRTPQTAQAPSTPTPSTPAKPLKPILKKDTKLATSPVAVTAAAAAAIVQPEVKTEEAAAKPPVVVTPAAVAPEVASIPETKNSIEKVEDVAMSQSVSTEFLDMNEENGGSARKPFFKKIFGGVRKKPSIRAKERKIRQNRHLRKVILPKNALMALYEVKGIQIGDFIINTNMEGGFTALVTVNNCQYEGTGNSKSNAKTNACEKALRDYIIKKMMQKPRGQSLCEPMDTSESNDATNGEESNVSADEADDVPMVNLASYALYKLFTAWENEGFHVPEFHTAAPPVTQPTTDVVVPKKSVGRNELPPNWELMHPATLLCIMRPRLTYTDCGNNGDPGNPIQTVKVIVDDQEFIGLGRSKKIARKNVAIAVCNSIFGTNFQVDETVFL